MEVMELLSCAELHVLLRAHDPAPIVINKGEGTIKFSSEPLYYHSSLLMCILFAGAFHPPTPPIWSATCTQKHKTVQYVQNVLKQQHCAVVQGRFCATVSIHTWIPVSSYLSHSVSGAEDSRRQLSLYIQLSALHMNGKVMLSPVDAV